MVNNMKIRFNNHTKQTKVQVQATHEDKYGGTKQRIQENRPQNLEYYI